MLNVDKEIQDLREKVAAHMGENKGVEYDFLKWIRIQMMMYFVD